MYDYLLLPTAVQHVLSTRPSRASKHIALTRS